MNKIGTLVIFIILYFLLKNYIPYGYYIIYPVRIFVTFLHEFGHAFFSMITGDSVVSLRINSDGSGLAMTSGGIKSIMIAGGYIGSAIFGGTLLFLSSRIPKSGKYIAYTIIGLMIFAGIFWFSNIMSTIILLIFAVSLFYIAKYFTNYLGILFECIGIMSLLYIIEDFNVGPSSDLASFAGILPVFFWKYIWLTVVLIIFGFFIKISYLQKDTSDKNI